MPSRSLVHINSNSSHPLPSTDSASDTITDPFGRTACSACRRAERQRPQVDSVEPKEIKSDVARAACAAQQVIELRSAGLVDRDDLAVENGIIDVEHTGHPLGELIEAGHDIAVARDQAIAALLEIAEGAEAVILELEQPVGVVERLFSPGRRDRLHARKGHDPHMGSSTFPGQSALSSSKGSALSRGNFAIDLRVGLPAGPGSIGYLVVNI